MIGPSVRQLLRFSLFLSAGLVVSSQVFAQFSASSSAEISVGQDGVGFVEVFDGDFSSTGAPVAFSGSASFGDPDVTGVFEISGSASASATAGILRARATTTVVENSVYDASIPYLTEICCDSNNDDFGIPSTAGFSAFASYVDRLQYGGLATNYKSRYIFRVSGNVTGTDGFAVVSIQHGDSTVQTIVFDQPGSFNQVMTSEAFVHGGAPQFFSLGLQASVDPFQEFAFDGDSGSVQFGNTVELLGVELRDADTDELLLGEVITADSGATSIYTVRQSIPEPGALLLSALAGLVALACYGRR